MQNEEPHDMHSSSNITEEVKSRKMQGWEFGMCGENRNTYRVDGGN
jgi:hypothetical protein